jgi:hypothetical protein
MKTPIHYESLEQIDIAFETLLKSGNLMKDGAICMDRYARAS